MKKSGRADLHIHTHYSDSTLSPEEVLEYARKADLVSIAITDHDCIDAISRITDRSSAYGIEVVPGIELTVDRQDTEIHILGYYIDTDNSGLLVKIKAIRDDRINRVYKMAELLGREGIPLDTDHVFEISGKGAVGRLHVALAMVDSGYVASIKEAFKKYIGFGEKCYVPHLKLRLREAIETITSAGGVPVLAHPALIGNESCVDECIGAGIRGIEVYHTNHNARDVEKYRTIAESEGLIVTGGSDCHGMGKGRVMIGTRTVDYEAVERLKAESEQIKKGA